METQTTSKSNVMEETIPINITKEEIDAFLQVMENFIHIPRIESFRKKVEIAKTMNYSAYYHTPELLMQKIYEVTGISKMEFHVGKVFYYLKIKVNLKVNFMILD